MYQDQVYKNIYKTIFCWYYSAKNSDTADVRTVHTIVKAECIIAALIKWHYTLLVRENSRKTFGSTPKLIVLKIECSAFS